jgi:hypothetical protein
MSETSRLYREHVERLMALCESGDENAARSLACLALVCEGWRYGDPDPTDPPDGGGCEVIDLTAYRDKLAA